MIETPRERPHLAPLSEVCADDAAVLALSVLRFVASGYMTGDVACWEAAHDGAERVLGAETGARLVAAMTGLMRALRAERLAEWSFLPATCCRATGHEGQLARCLDLARAGLAEETAREAARLTGGPTARTEAALRVAARLLNALPPDLRHRVDLHAPRPKGARLH